MAGKNSDDIISILLATDCHVGFLEKDPIRGQDSFVTFEEILKQAVKYDVDFILLGGDLFHDNKPSQKTLHQTMHLLRKYCMGDRPCQIEFLSDQSINFSHCKTPVVNYEDPNFNISHPVFSIHGNHDDPTGESSLSAIDLLSVCGLLNHFGKASSVDKIEISPLLLQKGQTKLALYGLGSVRDERLHRAFCDKKVKMLRPKDDPDSWFNLFAIHQNRAKHGTTNYIPEHFLDEFLDLVVWGHEHECLIDAEWSASGKSFYVTQPGSSVATSLSPGEAKPKHVGLLKIREKDFKLEKIPLRTVRPFVIDEVVLSDTSLDPSSEDQLTAFLKEKVECMLEQAQVINEMLPLIRLRVEYSGGFSALNPHRFGQLFVNRVANTKDILLFFRKKASYSRDAVKLEGTDHKVSLSISDADGLQMEDVIKEFLKQDDKNLELGVLSEKRMGKALKEFVEKEEKDAIKELVKWELGNVQKDLFRRNAGEDDIPHLLEEKKKNTDVNEEEESEEIERVLANTRIQKSQFEDSFGSSDEDMEIESEYAASKRGAGRSGTRGGRGSTRGRGTGGSRAATGTGRGSRGRRGGASQRNSLVTDSFITVSKASQKRTKKEESIVLDDDDMDEDSSNFPIANSRIRTPFTSQLTSSQESEEVSDPFSVGTSSRKRVRR